MADRPHQNLSNKLIAKIEWLMKGRIKNFNRMKNYEQFSEALDELLYALHLHLKNNPNEIDDIESSHQKVANGWVTKRNDLLESHNHTMLAYNLIKAEENIITRVERRGHLYALFFRILTTLSIGLSVMGIYALATYWDVNLPLMRPKL